MITYGVPESPFGGVKESGIGQVNGEIGPARLLPRAVDRRSIASAARRELLWFPYTARKASWLQRA